MNENRDPDRHELGSAFAVDVVDERGSVLGFRRAAHGPSGGTGGASARRSGGVAGVSLVSAGLFTVAAPGRGAPNAPRRRRWPNRSSHSDPTWSVGEGDGVINVPVTLSAPGTSAVSVAYSTANASAGGSCGSTGDYVALSGGVLQHRQPELGRG